MSDDEYAEALRILGSLISGKKRSDGRNWSNAFEALNFYLQCLDLPKQLPSLSVIHVAGTKGKGSTCAMVESILRSCGHRTGLFTSPHLCDVRERIRLDGRPVSRDVFLKHFWHVYKTLHDHPSNDGGMPAYFRFFTLLALKTFIEEKVDVAILEVGIGGRLDATNVVPQPVVCGVSSLGFDHMELLGHTLPEIAREKAGIFKKGSPAFTVQQPPDAQQSLQEVADRVGIPLTVAPPLTSFQGEDGQPVQLGLAGAHQAVNASLAVALVAAWERGACAAASPEAAARVQQIEAGRLPAEYLAGLRACEWPGRAQVVHDEVEAEVLSQEQPQLTFFLDGAHTAESTATCGRWFAEASRAQVQQQESEGPHGAGTSCPPERILLFNCMQERDPGNLLRPLIQELQAGGAMPHRAFFVPTDSISTQLKPLASDDHPDLTWQRHLCSVWRTNIPVGSVPQASPPAVPLPPVLGLAAQDATATVLPSLQATLGWLRRCARERPRVPLQVLVTGSLYLVGDTLRLLGKAPK